MRWLMAHRVLIIRALAWFGVLAIVILSVVPAPMRPTTGARSGFEHFAVFSLVAAAFAIGYRLSLARLLALSFLYCGGIELLQLTVPTRHARLSDFFIDVGSAWVAMCLVAVNGKLSMAYRLRRRRPSSIPEKSCGGRGRVDGAK